MRSTSPVSASPAIPIRQIALNNMWVNVGTGQFHLPTGAPMMLRGHVGLVMPDRDGLLERLREIGRHLEGTRFSYTAQDDRVDVVCPGQSLQRLRAGATFRTALARYSLCRIRSSGQAARKESRGSYSQVMMASRVAEDGKGGSARISSGQAQQLLFRETRGELPSYDGHHIQIYLAHFSGPHKRLGDLGLVSQEGGRYLYRFSDIKDPRSGEVLFTIEHELRSMTHPAFMRPLVNRNPARGVRDYAAGIRDDEWSGPPPIEPDRGVSPR